MIKKPSYRVMFTAGEASGDQHAANMFLALKKKSPDMTALGMGGTKMKAAGINVCYDSTSIAVIGVLEVLKHYGEIRRALRFMQQLLRDERPDLLICVDYKEFNFKLASYAKNIGIKVLFYVSPQVWAWRPGRVVKYGKVIDAMAVIFPFEVAYYQKHNIPVRYVGHPSVDKVHPHSSIEQDRQHFALDPNHPIVGLLPGSRGQEIKRMLPVMLQAAERIKQKCPKVQFLLPQADSISDEEISIHLKQQQLDVTIIKQQPYAVIQCCHAVMTTSGTATLEVALLMVPMVIVYKLSALTYYLGRLLVKTPFIGLPNIIAGRQIIKELIQHDANAEKIASEIINILQNKSYAKQIKTDLCGVKNALGQGGGSRNIADFALQILQGQLF